MSCMELIFFIFNNIFNILLLLKINSRVFKTVSVFIKMMVM